MESGFFEKNAVIIMLGSAGMLIMASTLVGIYLLSRRKILDQQKEMDISAEKHRAELVISEIETLENERQRIAGDLHDDVGMTLSALRLNLSLAFAQTGEGSVKNAVYMQCKDLVDNTIHKVRQISHGLVSPELQVLGLNAAVKALCESTEVSSGVHFHFICTNMFARPDAKTETAVYRIVQELINNTLKHAGAGTIAIEIIQKQDDLYVSYKDDGKGFDTTVTFSSGLGLLNMESRVQLLGGTFAIISAPGKGFAGEIHIPSAFAEKNTIPYHEDPEGNTYRHI